MTTTDAPTTDERQWARILFPNTDNPGTLLFARRAAAHTAGLRSRIDELESELAWWQNIHWREL